MQLQKHSDTDCGDNGKTRNGSRRPRGNPLRSVVAAALAASAMIPGSQPVSTWADDAQPIRLVRPAESCGYQSPEEALEAIRRAVAAGQILDPSKRPLPAVAPRVARPGLRGGGVPTVTPSDIFPFEDSASLLTTNFSDGQLFNLMAQASNALMSAHGDNYDFIGFFLNFVPDHQIGSAFYLGLENTTTGLGQGTFNFRPNFGVAGDNIEGWVMMWNQASWGTNDSTMLVLGQEFEHRWGMFLNNLLGGRRLQGNNAGCGRSSHWNWRVDGQGSGMEIREWIGASPAVLGGDCAPGGFFFLCFNSDVGLSPGGLGAVWSYPDLYLMGYVSPAEMDAGASELRYMDSSDCFSAYNGVISTFDSADIILTNGVRTPDSTTSQKDFRTGWVMFHLPGAPPTSGQINNVVNILNRWSETWQWSTLNRGTMDNTLVQLFDIIYPNGTPPELIADQPTTIAVQTVDVVGTPDTSSGLLHFSVDDGAEQTSPLTFLGGDDYEATLPGLPCTSTVEFFVTINALTGETITTASTTVPVATIVDLSDDFETDQGWTVSGDAADGLWVRADPIGGASAPSTDFDGSGQCWVTENAVINSDVDGGTTILTSPVFDLSAINDPFVQYARWYFNDGGAAPMEDVFVVEVSDDGGGTWVNLETVGPTAADPNPEVSGGWFRRAFRVTDFVSANSQFRIRFLASDLGGASTVEAGVDAFQIDHCLVPCAAHSGDLNGDVATDALDVSDFIAELFVPTGDPDVVCAGDFDDSGVIDLPDVAGFVVALLSQ